MNNMQTYILYYLLILITSILAYFSVDIQKTKYRIFSKFIFFLVMLFPILVSSFRYGIGTDYFSYEVIYYHISQYGSILEALLEYNMEPSWILLNYLAEIIFNDVKYVFIISSLLIIIFNFIAITSFREKLSIGTAIFIFMCTLYFPSFNMIRFSIAASILLVSFKFIKEKKLLKFILLVLLAGSFHFTALIYIPLYWFLNYKNHSFGMFKKSLLYLSFVVLILGFDYFYNLLIGIELFSKYESYQLGNNQFGVGNIIIRFPIIMLILLNLKKLRLKDSFIYDITVVYFITFLLLLLGYRAGYIGRIAIYFEMTQVFILASIVRVQSNLSVKNLVKIIIFVYFILWFTYQIVILNNHETIPYIWN